MKLSKILMMVFVCSFIVGVGLMAITPAPVQAKAIPDINPCERSCYAINCHLDASCNPVTERMHQKCYGNALLVDPCAVLNCGCIYIGCGPLCDID